METVVTNDLINGMTPEFTKELTNVLAVAFDYSYLGDPEYLDFVDLARRRLIGYPAYRNWSSDVNAEVAKGAGFMYDAVWLYAWTLDAVLRKGDDPFDGRRFFKTMVYDNITFQGITGEISIDEYGERHFMFDVYDFNGASFEMVLHYYDKNTTFKNHPGKSIRLGGSENKPPLNKPTCGYSGELCIVNKKNLDVGVIIGPDIAVVEVLSVIVYAIMWYKKKQFEEHLLQSAWKIPHEDLILMKDGAMKSGSSIGSRASELSHSTVERIANAHQIARYKGLTVWLKKLSISNTGFNRAILLEFKQV